MDYLWTDPAGWTIEQWLSVAILGFILLAILVMIHRLLTILNMSRRPDYRPNFRRLRKFHHGSTASTSNDDDEDEDDRAD